MLIFDEEGAHHGGSRQRRGGGLLSAVHYHGRGVLIGAVSAGSSGARAGAKPGDRVVSVAGHDVSLPVGSLLSCTNIQIMH